MIIISYWIEADGSVNEVQPFSSIEELSELAAKGMKSLPHYTPTLKKGQPIRAKHKFMLNFDASKQIRPIQE